MRRWLLVTISIKQDDTMPALKLRLKDSAGTAVNLTGATVTVAIQHYLKSEINFYRAAHVADAATGEVWVVWQPEETKVEGLYRVEIKVTYQDGNRETFPGDSYLVVNILKRLGD